MDQTATVADLVPDDSDLMVTEEVVGEADDVAVAQPTAVQPLKPLKKSKILVTISDDLSYALAIDGHTMAAVMDSISNDEYMKNEWHSWHRFITNPQQFFIYIFDNDFNEYVRYRPDTPIRHLSKLKIRNKLYVNQTGVKSAFQPMISHSPLIEDMIEADIEPTDLLACELPEEPMPSTSPVSQPLVANHSNDIINHTYHHNYHLNSPSAPTSQTISTVAMESDSDLTPSQPIRSHNSSQSSKATTNTNKPKVTVKVLNSSTKSKSNSSETDSISGDLLADALTGPAFEWTQEQTFGLLEACKAYTKELAPKNVADVHPTVWEELANQLNDKGLGSFYNLICKNRFAQLRKTYIDVLRFPNLRDEANWPYFDQMKQILGDSPEELKSPKMSTRAQTKLKMKPKVRARPELRNTVQMALKRRAAVQQKNRLNTRPNNRQAVRPQTTAVKNVMKNVKNNNTEVSELYVALLNLVKKNMKEFGTEKKNLIWDRIEKELKNAGFTWSADSLRGLFHRLRYQYIDIVKASKNGDQTSWPYYRYFECLDLSVFRKNKVGQKAEPKTTNNNNRLKKKKGPGRPRKLPSTDEKTSAQTLADNQIQTNDYDQSSDGESVENKRKASQVSV